MAVLAKGVPSPLAKESDEEKAKEAEKPAADAKAGDAAKATGAKAEEPKKDEKKPVEVKFDADGLSQRILAMPMKAGVYANLAPGAANQLFYRRAASTDPDADAALYRYDLEKRKEDTLLDKADGFALSADTKRALVRVKEDWHLVAVADKLDLAKFKLDVARVQVRVDPPAEWAQILDEAWRINRDYFYDPAMHGADWPAMRKKYAAFLPDLATRNDLYRVIRWMLSELAVGHSTRRPATAPSRPRRSPAGCSAPTTRSRTDATASRRSTAASTGLPTCARRSPSPGVDVKAGEYLLAVEGKDLRPRRTSTAFESTAGKIVEITVGPNPDGKGSRTVKVVPLENERALRNRDWVEGNLRRVNEATQGRVAYVYVPNTAEAGTRTSSGTSSRRPTARPSSSTSATTAAARWRTTTSTSCAGRWSATGPCATAPTSRRRSPGSTGRRSCSSTRPRAPAATSCPGCSGSSSSGRSSASAPGAASSGSSASRC